MTALPGNIQLPSTQEEISKLVKLGETGSIPVEHFFTLPKKSQFKISPDGTHYAYVKPFNRRQNIHVVNLASDTEVRLTSFEDRSVAGFAWANSDQIVFLKDEGGNENFHLHLAQIQTGESKNMTPFTGVRAELLDILPDDDQHIIVAMNKNTPQFFEPYKLNITNGQFIQLASNDDPQNPITAWYPDHEGRIRLASRVIGGVETALLYRPEEDAPFQEIIRTDFKTEVRPLFFDFSDPNVLLVASNLGRDKTALVKFDLEKKEESEILFEHKDVDVGRASYSRKEKKLVAAHYTTDKAHRHFFDALSEHHFQTIRKNLPEVEIGVTSTSKDETRWIIRTYSDVSLGAYYLYDTVSESLQWIADVRSDIDPEMMRPQKAIQYTSRDGLTIHGYLTLPQGEGPFPMIVNPHGGPWHRDSWGFNPEIQLFANRGYAVLQMNFRGSTGYGRSFWEKSFKQWGQSMQDDITDGVQWAIDKGIAKADKIAIYGGSYGGYATLAGVCFTPELYCCAVDYVGVSNLFTFMKTIPPYWEPYLAMMYEMVGHPEKDKDMMEAYSPALQVHRIKAPLFVIQGANDPRVHIDESDQMVANLRDRGVEVPYMVKYDEGHGFHNEENRFEVYKAMLGFFHQHLH